MTKFNPELIKSRFILSTDESSNFLLYPIIPEWWSRTYEYIWASKFSEPNDICLDAACGVEHHFKYHLAYTSKEVYCCDLDPRILNKNTMLTEIKANYGNDAFNVVNKVYDKINFSVCNLISLPYADKKFDKIYCISVLEHLGFYTMISSLKEFTRTLKDDGIIVLTFDYPSINLDQFKNALAISNLDFLGEVDFNIPPTVLTSYLYQDLKCVRVVLKKKIY